MVTRADGGTEPAKKRARKLNPAAPPKPAAKPRTLTRKTSGTKTPAQKQQNPAGAAAPQQAEADQPPKQPRSTRTREPTRSAFAVAESDRPGHLRFMQRPGSDPVPPPDQLELQIALDVTCRAIRARIHDETKFKEAYGSLLKLAQAIFPDGPALVDQGKQWLQAYREDIDSDFGGATKNEYLKKYLMASLIGSALILGAAIVVKIAIWLAGKYGMLEVKNSTATALHSIAFDSDLAPMHIGFVMAAALWGMWLFRYFEYSKYSLEKLSLFEWEMLEPWSLYLANGLVVAITVLILLTGAVKVSIGPFDATDMRKDIIVALFVGVGLGYLSEKILPEFVRRHLERAFGSVQGTVGRRLAKQKKP